MSTDLNKAKPDEVVAEIRRQIRKAFGDKIENKVDVYARNGFYFIDPPARPKWLQEPLGNLGGLRRKNLPALFKALNPKPGDPVKHKVVDQPQVGDKVCRAGVAHD